MTRKQLLIARIVFVVYILAVLVLCFGKFEGTEDVPMDLWGIPTDKIAHFLMFFPFPILAYLAFDRYQGKRWPSIPWAAVAFACGCAFAAGTELVQSRLSYRSGDPVDFQADFLALLVSSFIVLIVILFKHKK
jgi:VanZ family protein